MFFIGGISSKQDTLDFNQSTVCSNCGKYGRFEIITEYMSFSLFFIPILKWNNKFYVRSSCCSSIYSIDKELGGRIARGESITLKDQDLQLIKNGQNYYVKQCLNCSFETNDDYTYCPKCATLL